MSVTVQRLSGPFVGTIPTPMLLDIDVDDEDNIPLLTFEFRSTEYDRVLEVVIDNKVEVEEFFEMIARAKERLL